MIGPGEALARLLALGAPVPLETVPLVAAAGRWAAEPVDALRTQPARDLSAMDGYAICHADLPGPWRVTDESAAGLPARSALGAGEAIRIFTGATLPEGADTILIQEDAARVGDRLTLTGNPPRPGQHIRSAGCDFARHDRLIEPGDLLTPPRLGLAALAGHGTLAVRRRIRVALIATGSELVPPGIDPGADLLPNSNAPMLAALLAPLPVDVIDLGIVADDRTALADAFAAARAHDVIVTTGGASVGDHDLVRPVLLEIGATLDFWKIAMRPGKPLMAGTLRSAIVLGLPGNPVSAFVTATLFLLPLIRHLSGARDPEPLRLGATLAAPLPPAESRTDYVRAVWQDGQVAPLGGDSGMLLPLAAATLLIERPAGSPAARVGDRVTVISLA
ncbi:MAG: molybdopterin molybdotransferase MoeA [Sphingomonadaceae bacterium]